MRQQAVYYRQVGIRGPGDKALRPVVLPLSLGVWRMWRSAQPAGVHIAMKRGVLIGRLVVHSFFLPAKRQPGKSAPSNSTAKPAKKHYRTEVHSLSQTVNHAGIAFSVGKI